MATTKAMIREWLGDAGRDGATHMLVVCDSFDWEDYPVSVMPGESARDKAEEYAGRSMQRVMECYDLSMELESQLDEHRAFHF